MSDRIGSTTIVAVFGGLASDATGGDFYEGAMSAAFVHLYNDLSARTKQNASNRAREAYLQKQANLRAKQKRENNKPLVFTIGLDNLNNKDRAIWEQRMLVNTLQMQHMKAHNAHCTCGPTSDQMGLVLSVGAAVFEGPVGIGMGLGAIALDVYQGDDVGRNIGIAAFASDVFFENKYIQTGALGVDIAYGVWQVVK